MLPFIGALFATCCHHLCAFDSYVNPAFLDSIGLGGRDNFTRLARMTSWAVGLNRSGPRKKEDESSSAGESTDKSGPEGGSGKDDDVLAGSTRDESASKQAALALSVEERIEIGRTCKHLLDWGRVRLLEAAGWLVRLVIYAEEDITPENSLIVASRML